MRHVIFQRVNSTDTVIYDSPINPPVVYNIDIARLWKAEDGKWWAFYRVPDYSVKKERVTTRQLRALNNARAFGMITNSEYSRKVC